jgi:TonB family protein
MRCVRWTLWAAIVIVSGVQTLVAAVSPELQKVIRTATLEVVRKKPEADPLSYEKPLPFELLPYAERTDAYQSVGTAFSLGNNTYVTAAHVLITGINSQYGAPSLRASDGTIYSIDRILKFSAARDFVIFSLGKDAAPIGLGVNRDPQVDDPVLAVGNALGDGVVIREGLLTSQTPEEQDGRWKWLRFSAAASPGNSGGPLLDGNGKVIGVVIAKSPNENLNYSLPIREALDAPDGTASFDQRVLNGFPVLRTTRTYSYRQEFKLPLKWPEFAKAYQDVVTHHSEQARLELLHAFDEKLFPKGDGTESLLYDVDLDRTPRLIVQQADNTWAAVAPPYQNAQLAGDGYLKIGTIIDSTLSLLQLHRSDTASDDAFYMDSKALMDTLLKGLPITRTVGQDNVRVTSLGPALSETIHGDHYGRKWQQRVWPLPYLDAYIVGMLLPTPDGYVALLQFAPAQLLADAKSQSTALVDYVDVSYWGTVKQWQAYLKRRPLLPQTLGDVKLELGNALTLHTHRFVFSVPALAMPFDQQSELGVGMGFMRDAQQVTWDAGAAWLYQDTQRKSYAGMWRQPQPPATARLDLRNKFTNLRDRRSPYDSQSSRETDSTYSVSSAMDAPGKTPGTISTDLVYGLTLALEGGSNDIALLTQQKMLLSASQVLEQGTGAEVLLPKAAAVESNKLVAPTKAPPEFLQKLIENSHEITEQAGKDSRARTFDEDVHEFVLPLINPDGTPTAEDIVESRERWHVLYEYWQAVIRLKANRNAWNSFLEYNYLPADTPHSPDVAAREARLGELITGMPTSEWAKQTLLVVNSYSNERRLMVNQMVERETTTEVVRTSSCPAPAATEVAGDAKVRYSPNMKPLPDLYPVESKRLNEEGVILLALHINQSGCAIGAKIIGSSGFKNLDAAALKTYEYMEFLPAVSDGKAIESWVKVPVNFQMDH